MNEVANSFRALHELPGAFVMPNPWDIGSARLLATMGFRALATTSAGMAHARGCADGAVPKDMVLSHCREIVGATSLPVSADLEKGFGDSPESAFAAIVEAAGTGLAGCSIEDHTGDPGAPIFERTLAVERIQAADEARRSLAYDFVLTARCENLLWGRPDIDAVIERLQAYAAAGADVLYAPGLGDLETIHRVCTSVSKPVNVVVETKGAMFSVNELVEAGVKRISLGSALALLAYGSLLSAAREMTRHGSFGFLRDVADFGEVDAYFK